MEVPTVSGPVVAFCGIARPDQFFAGLESKGIQIAERLAFRDHFRYRKADINDLIDAATLPGPGISALITTEKDHIRLGNLISTFPASLHLHTARLTIEIENESAAIDWLIDRLSLAPHDPPL
jgi:tetraacyldisaccharide 4'-kinase